MTRFYTRVVVAIIALGLLMGPIVTNRAEISSNRLMSINQESDYYQERVEVWVEPEGDIWARASVEGAGVQLGKTSLDYSGAEWEEFHWMQIRASESRNPNEENVWVDLNFESRDPYSAEEAAKAIMRQINSRLLVEFEFRGSEIWVDERDPNSVYDDVDMVRVNYGVHVDFPWFVNELDESLPKEYGGLAENLDVTEANEAWCDIYRHHDDYNGYNDDQFYEQLGVGFHNFIADLEGGHELELTELVPIERIERSEFSHNSEYYFNLPDVDEVSTDPPIGENEGYSVHESEWFEGWRNAWRRDVRLNIHDPSISFDTFTVWFDYHFVPRAFQTYEHVEIRLDPFGNLEVNMGIQDPEASITPSIDYESDLYEPVMNLNLNVNRPHMMEEDSGSSTAMGGQEKPEANVYFDIDFYTIDPELNEIADTIAADHAADLGIEFERGHDDEWDGHLHVHYYGWADWSDLVQRVKNLELNDKSPLFDYINFEEESGLGCHVWFDHYAGFPEKAIGVHRWFDQYYQGTGEFYLSTHDILPDYAPLRKGSQVDRTHFRIKVPGNVEEVTPHPDEWGQGYDVWHHEWDEQGARVTEYELNIFDESLEIDEFGVLFEFDFFEGGTDIKGPEIDFKVPHQDEYVSGLYNIEIGIWDDVSGVDEGSVSLEVGSNYLMIDWIQLRLEHDGDTWKARWDTSEFGGDGTYNLLVRCKDHEGHKSETEISVVVDNIEDDGEHPNIEFIEPLNRDNVAGKVQFIAEVYDDAGLQFVGVTIDGRGYAMDHDGDDEYSYTWDSSKKADGEHEIVIIAIGMDGEESQEDIMIVSNNDVTEDTPIDQLSGSGEPVFFVPGFSLLEALFGLSLFGFLVATRKKRHI